VERSVGIYRFMRSIIKYILSFRKRDWGLGDYPITVRNQEAVPLKDASLRIVPWIVQIPYWIRMVGYGDTRGEAYADLARKFNEYKGMGNKLPRPGTKVPLEVAPRVNISPFDHIAPGFFESILGMDYKNILITDGSSLWDFHWGEPEEMFDKVRNAYGVDISDIDDGNLAHIFKRIDESQHARY
jgi:hypothetical protein